MSENVYHKHFVDIGTLPQGDLSKHTLDPLLFGLVYGV
jgi:hypothetical protein